MESAWASPAEQRPATEARRFIDFIAVRPEGVIDA